MKLGHQIDIEPWFDLKTQRWNAKVSLREFRNGSQYGGTVVWEETAKRYCSHNTWMTRVMQIVRSKALTLITYKTK